MKYIIIFLIALMSLPASAHVKLKTSIPADGAQLSSPPDQLVITLSAESRVAKAILRKKGGEPIDFGFRPTKLAAKEFSWEMPILTNGAYEVEILYFGNDGHKMKSYVGFSVR